MQSLKYRFLGMAICGPVGLVVGLKAGIAAGAGGGIAGFCGGKFLKKANHIEREAPKEE